MSDLDKLKQLLLGKDIQQLRRLQKRLDTPSVRAKEISVLLPYAIRKESLRGDRLAKSLQEPVEACLRIAIKQDPRRFADALFPIMGPAIRRSISEALRAMLQSINQVLDQSFSIKGLSWRWEAWRSGASFHEVVLRHTLLYRVEQILLIQNESGLLIEHLLAEDVETQDPDAVSAMLSAIQDFVNDSFRKASDRDKLGQIELGDHTVWLLHGPEASVAVVIRGLPDLELRVFFNESLEKIHQAFATDLNAFDGSNPDAVAGTRELLAPGLLSVHKEKTKKRRSFAILFPVALMVGLSGYWGYLSWWESQQQQALLRALQQVSGIIVQSMEVQNDQLLIRGLRDYLSQSPESVVLNSQYEGLPVTFVLSDYYSGEPEIAVRRVDQVLQPPAGVKVSVQQHELTLLGVADKVWIDQAMMLSRVIPGIRKVNRDQLITRDRDLFLKLSQRLNIPSRIQLSVNELVVSFSGRASIDWVDFVKETLKNIPDIKAVQWDVELNEVRELIRMKHLLESIHVYFLLGSDQVSGQAESLGQLIGVVRKIHQLSLRLGKSYRINLVGITDHIGSYNDNEHLGRQRADNVLQFLTQHKGINQALFTLSHRVVTKLVKHASECRRVDFKLYIDNEN